MKDFLVSNKFALVLKAYTAMVLIFVGAWVLTHGLNDVNSALRIAIILMIPPFVLTSVIVHMKKQ